MSQLSPSLSPVTAPSDGPNGEQSHRRRGELYAVIAALAWSLAGILQRQLTLSAAMQTQGRAVFAFVTLAVYLTLTRRGQGMFRLNRSGWTMTLALFVATGSFVYALNHASVAHVLLFQALSPFVAALLGVRLLHERVPRSTVVAMLIAISGVVVMIGGPGGGSLLGNGLAAAAAVAFATVVVISRQERGASTLPALCLSQGLLVIVFVPFMQLSHVTLASLGWLALLGIVQLVFANLFFAQAARFVPAGPLALILLLEIVLGPLWTWLGLNEAPSATTLIGGGIVLAAVAGQVLVRRRDAAPLPLN
ncbi:MAG: DMT family transporter [Solirubrobacteraceae bacterium]